MSNQGLFGLLNEEWCPPPQRVMDHGLKGGRAIGWVVEGIWMLVKMKTEMLGFSESSNGSSFNSLFNQLAASVLIKASFHAYHLKAPR